MVRSSGYRVWDENDREYIDYIMGLGSVALGYGYSEVTRAAVEAVEDGVVGPLAPVIEEDLAAQISGLMPWIEQVRFSERCEGDGCCGRRLDRSTKVGSGSLAAAIMGCARLGQARGVPRSTATCMASCRKRCRCGRRKRHPSRGRAP